MHVTKSEQNLLDMEFILSELTRLATMNVSQLKAHFEVHPEDHFHDLRMSDGSLRTSSAAISRKFQEIAVRSSEKDPEQHTYDLNSLVEKLKSEFVLRLIELRGELNKKTTDKIVGKALAKLKKDRKTITHFVPCEFLYRKKPELFQIGPVIFRTSENFFAKFGERIEANRQSEQDRVRELWRKNPDEYKFGPEGPRVTYDDVLNAESKLANKFEDFYKELGWVAEVQVPTSLPEVSFRKANLAIEAALDVLKLLLGEQSGKQFRIGYDKGHRPESSMMSINEDNEIELSWKIGGYGSVSWDSWYEDITKDNALDLKLAGTALTYFLRPTGNYPLVEKWLGALHWYGQGVTETSNSARIVKFVAALEQVTVAKKSHLTDITDTVTTRTKFLCYESIPKAERDFAFAQIDRLYRLRSELLHGQISPNDKKVEEVAKAAGRITQQAIATALHFYAWVSTQKKDNLGDLESEYERRVSDMYSGLDRH
jgi:hypothetical protein